MSPSKVTPLQLLLRAGEEMVSWETVGKTKPVFLPPFVSAALAQLKGAGERGCLGPTQESHEFGNRLLWIPFPSGFSGVRQTELRFAKLILALRHHPWINKSNERTKIVNHFTAFPFKMVSSAWTFLAANTILWVISTTDNPDLPQKLRNRGILISGLPLAQLPKSLPAMQETWVQSLGQEDPLEKEMTAHSRILGWESHGQRSLVATVHGVTKSWTWLSD